MPGYGWHLPWGVKMRVFSVKREVSSLSMSGLSLGTLTKVVERGMCVLEGSANVFQAICSHSYPQWAPRSIWRLTLTLPLPRWRRLLLPRLSQDGAVRPSWPAPSKMAAEEEPLVRLWQRCAAGRPGEAGRLSAFRQPQGRRCEAPNRPGGE